jgi:drug/metabolite transporter (DMT)-like permease
VIAIGRYSGDCALRRARITDAWFAALAIEHACTWISMVGTRARAILPAALIVDRPWELTPPGIRTWGAMVGLAILGTALATFLGAAILNEPIAPRRVAGMAVIALGLALIDRQPLRWLPARAPTSRRGRGSGP